MDIFTWLENNRYNDRNARFGLLIFVFITVYFFINIIVENNNQKIEIESMQVQLAVIQEDINNLQTDIIETKTKVARQEELVEELRVEVATINEDVKAVISEIEWLKVAYQFLVAPGKLTRTSGVAWFEGHKETFYNLDMTGVLYWSQMRLPEDMKGWEYWVREDGCKMYGDYIIVAADQEIHPFGSIVMTSLGEGIVLDTGTFIYSNSEQIDIATNW